MPRKALHYLFEKGWSLVLCTIIDILLQNPRPHSTAFMQHLLSEICSWVYLFVGGKIWCSGYYGGSQYGNLNGKYSPGLEDVGGDIADIQECCRPRIRLRLLKMYFWKLKTSVCKFIMCVNWLRFKTRSIYLLPRPLSVPFLLRTSGKSDPPETS